MATKQIAGGVVKAVQQVKPAEARIVKPIISGDYKSTQLAVKSIYKKWQKQVPNILHYYNIRNKTVAETRLSIKHKFLKNKDITDPRQIDLLIHTGIIELRNTLELFNQEHHFMNVMYPEDTRPEDKPKDFLGKFLSGHE